MFLSEISIRRPVFAWMLMAALIVFGGISFMRMGVGLLPDVDFPVVSVSVTLEGAAPGVMETEIVDVIEDAIMTVQGVTDVRSSARNSFATISIEFELNRDIDAALQEVQTKITQAQRHLPREMDPPVIAKTNPEDQPVMWLSFSSDTYPLKEMMAYVRDHLKGKFSTLPGVGDVFLGGYLEPNLRIWVSEKNLNRYALTIMDVISTLANEHSELPGGRIETKAKEFNVRTLGEADSVGAFENIVISSRGGQPNYSPIFLKQVARIEEGLADIRRISRSNGRPSIGLGIRKQRGANAVEVAGVVKRKIAEVSKILPEGMLLTTSFDGTRFIQDAVDELNLTLILSAILTALVCWMFLGSWSSTVNILMAIPTSVVGTFIVLYFSGFTLNTFTLLGLTLVIGIVVDDAIMVLENIVRHREEGKTRLEAALVGSREITFAAIASTVSIIAIFLPVVFIKGAIGRFFFQFGVTMTVAVLLSLLEALTLTPMRCSRFLDAGERKTRLGRLFENFMRRLQRGYKLALESTLNHRWKVLGGSLLFFAATLYFLKLINKEFVPAQDQSILLVRLQTPVGSSIEFTDGKIQEAEKFLMQRPEVARVYMAIGGFGGGEVNSAVSFVTLKPPGSRGTDPGSEPKPGHELTQQEFMDLCRAQLNKIPDIKTFVQDLSMRGIGAHRGFPVEFTVRGPEWEKLAEYSQKMMRELEKTGLVTDIDSDYQAGMPEIRVVPDRVQAALHGVSINVIGQTVRAMIGGVLAGRYPKGGHRYDIRVRLLASERDTAEKIKNIFVRNNRGELIALSKVVRMEEKPTLQVISRKGRERAVTVFANVRSGKSQSDALQSVETIAKEQLPAGYRAVLSGSAQTYKESFSGLFFALILGIIVAYMILASQFNSFWDPLAVLMALPFSVSGALVALWIGGQSLNIYSLIGLLLLMGIVKKNSILLVDFTNQIRERANHTVRGALTHACPIRLRPILMTSVSTIAGAFPPALAIGPGAEARIPMAIAVIGGVIVSTALTLFVVPCVYSLVAGITSDRGLAHRERRQPNGPEM